jgi:hypothetical protein
MTDTNFTGGDGAGGGRNLPDKRLIEARVMQSDPRYARWATALTGLLCAASFAITIHVYDTAPSHVITRHIVDKFHREFDRVQSLEEYLFVGPAFQALIFLMSLPQILFWKNFLRKMIEESSKPDPSFARRGDPVIAYSSVCIMMVVMSVFLLGIVISNIITLQTTPGIWKMQ